MMHTPHEPTPRLLHVTTVADTLIHLRELIDFTAGRGIEVHFASSPGPQLDALRDRGTAQTHAVPMRRAISPLADLVSVARLCRVIRRVRPAIVHAHTPKAGLLGMLAAWLTRTPVRIYHVHGLRYATARAWRRKLLMACERWAGRLATRVLCVSRSAQRQAIDDRLMHPGKIDVLLHGSIRGLDAAGRFNPQRLPADARTAVRRRYGIPDDAVVVGFIGRIVRDKGIDELAAAWQRLRDDLPKLHLLLTGCHEDNDPVSDEVKQLLDADGRVHCIGLEWDTPPLLAAMDMFCLPTYREGLPYALLEASAMRLPIVATQVTGCVDAVVDGQSGTLVPPHDAAALADAIHRYATDPALARRHGQAGRQRVLRDFDPQAVFEALWSDYVDQLADVDIPLPSPVRRRAA